MAWSEPLFLFLTFSGLFVLDVYMKFQGDELITLCGSSERCRGINALCRNRRRRSGHADFIFLPEKISAAKAQRESVIFGAIAGLPFVLWLLRNFFMTHDATNRKFVFHPVLHQISRAAQSTLSLWLFQGQLPIGWSLPVGILVVAVLGFLWMRLLPVIRL